MAIITRLSLMDKDTMVIYGDGPDATVWISTIDEICRQIVESGAPIIDIELNTFDTTTTKGMNKLLKRARRIARATGYIIEQSSDRTYFMRQAIQ